MVRKGIAFILIIASFLAMASVVSTAEEKAVYVTSTGLYIRKSASADSEALNCAKNGEKLTVLKEQGDWYYVRYGNIATGYVSRKFVSTQKPSGASSGSASTQASESLPARIADIDTPNASRSGDRNNDVKKLQQALKLAGYYYGSCDGIFGGSTETAVKQFQRAKGLTPDGIAGKVTVRTLFGENPPNSGGSSSDGASGGGGSGSTLKIDWYKGGSSILPAGAYFTVKDIRSGVTFKCRHLFGANHIDAEPVTKDDTAKMLKAYGGAWSWNRRPVLISYNGKVYAASMNGMPHGSEEIYDNNFDGQFCIHFLNSKTHGSSKVDPDHQACVNEAAKATW